MSLIGPVGLPPEQQAIIDRCFHPSGKFEELRREEIEQSIPERFEEQVKKCPERLAIRTNGVELTYSQLSKEANKVANAILARRGRMQEPIALLFEHGVSVIVAILGALKAGKFYTALDGSYPEARIASTLDDSQAGLLLTDSKNLEMATLLSRGRLPLLNIEELDLASQKKIPA